MTACISSCLESQCYTIFLSHADLWFPGFHLDTEENNNLVPGFLGSLIGIRPGDARSFPIQFPESFEQESLRGVRAQFTVSVTSKIPHLKFVLPMHLSNHVILCLYRSQVTRSISINLVPITAGTQVFTLTFDVLCRLCVKSSSTGSCQNWMIQLPESSFQDALP